MLCDLARVTMVTVEYRHELSPPLDVSLQVLLDVGAIETARRSHRWIYVELKGIDCQDGRPG